MRNAIEIYLFSLNKKLKLYKILSIIFIIINIILISWVIVINKNNSDKVNQNKQIQTQETLINNTNDILLPIEIEEIDICETTEETKETQEVEITDYNEESVSIIKNVDEHNFNVYHIAKVVWGEARGCSKLEQSAVVWCILNRVDAGYGTAYEVITSPNQFAYFREIEPYQDILDLVDDVLHRWYREKNGETNVGRTLPKEYKYFWGDNIHNYFRINIKDQVYWDWGLPNPYEN